jgi:hypothetical protein
MEKRLLVYSKLFKSNEPDIFSINTAFNEEEKLFQFIRKNL